MLQIETEGDAVTACAFSSSGEMMAFGGSGGYTHLWATTATPRVNMGSQPLDFPTPAAQPPRLTEQDSFALPFPYGATQVGPQPPQLLLSGPHAGLIWSKMHSVLFLIKCCCHDKSVSFRIAVDAVMCC